jgi:hypothetical protein
MKEKRNETGSDEKGRGREQVMDSDIRRLTPNHRQLSCDTQVPPFDYSRQTETEVMDGEPCSYVDYKV